MPGQFCSPVSYSPGGYIKASACPAFSALCPTNCRFYSFYVLIIYFIQLHTPVPSQKPLRLIIYSLKLKDGDGFSCCLILGRHTLGKSPRLQCLWKVIYRANSKHPALQKRMLLSHQPVTPPCKVRCFTSLNCKQSLFLYLWFAQAFAYVTGSQMQGGDCC